MFSFLLLSRRQLIPTNVFWITIIIFQSCQPLAVKVGLWDYGHILWRLELQFRKQILHSALGLARAKVWSPQGVPKKVPDKIRCALFRTITTLNRSAVYLSLSGRGNTLIYSANVRDRAHLILLGTFFGTPCKYKGIFAKIVTIVFGTWSGTSKLREEHTFAFSIFWCHASHISFGFTSNSGFHILIQRALYHQSQSSQIQKNFTAPYSTVKEILPKNVSSTRNT